MALQRTSSYAFEDTLRLTASWRIYRRMDGAHDERLTRGFALVIRSRAKR